MLYISPRALPRHTQQEGMALVMALIFLVLLTLIGVSAMSNSGLEERMASNMQSQLTTFQVVESAIIETMKTDITFVNATNTPAGVVTTHNFGNHAATSTTTLTGPPQNVLGYSIGTFVDYPFEIVASSSNAATGANAQNTQGVKRTSPKPPDALD